VEIIIFAQMRKNVVARIVRSASVELVPASSALITVKDAILMNSGLQQRKAEIYSHHELISGLFKFTTIHFSLLLVVLQTLPAVLHIIMQTK